MNLFGRLFWVLLSAWRGVRLAANTVVNHSFRVWPHDLGWRDHLPNYRFYSFMELGRFGYWHGTRLALSGQFRVRMIAAQDLTYLRPILPFQRFSMETERLGWDAKYVYFQHRFYQGERLVAIGLVKEACLKGGKVVAPASLFAHCAPTLAQHAIIDDWQRLQQTVKQPGNQTGVKPSVFDQPALTSDKQNSDAA